jgi:hypothetical protein
MPFKKTKDGWEYDPKGKGRIPSKPNLFEDRPPMRNQYGWPMKNFDEVDWERLNKEVEERNQSG